MWSRREFLVRSAAATVTFVDGPAIESAAVPEVSKLITPEARKAVEAGLRFLAENQNGDGCFGSGRRRGNVGITSLSALAFVAAGHGPDDRAYGKVVNKALDFVISQENRSGTHPGYLHNPDPFGAGVSPMYEHAFGTLFLAHLHGKVKGEKQNVKLDAALGRAVKLIVSSQNKEGGWRYRPTSKDADIVVTACQMMALVVARQSDVKVPKETTEAGVTYIKRCFDPTSEGFHYIAGLGRPNVQAFARTAAAVAVLQVMGVRGNEVDKGLTYLVRNRPASDPRAYINYFFGHYYAAMAMRVPGGETWKRWYPAVSKEVVDRQERNGSWRDIIDPHYATAMACLVLLAPEGRLAVRVEQKRKE